MKRSVQVFGTSRVPCGSGWRSSKVEEEVAACRRWCVNYRSQRGVLMATWDNTRASGFLGWRWFSSSSFLSVGIYLTTPATSRAPSFSLRLLPPSPLKFLIIHTPWMGRTTTTTTPPPDGRERTKITTSRRKNKIREPVEMTSRKNMKKKKSWTKWEKWLWKWNPPSAITQTAQHNSLYS